MEKLKILGFAGSLRKGSYNMMLLMAAVELAPVDAEIEVYDIKDIPIFNQDFENTPPEQVLDFKAKIKAADAILIVTPEYNYSIPGVLKNAIDWASRPPQDNSWNEKPVGIMGAAGGMLGTARAQYHLRQSLLFVNAHALNPPEVFVTFAKQKFNENGVLTDQPTRDIIKKVLENLVAWTRRLKQPSQ